MDLLVIETFFDLHHLLLAVEEARRAADVPLIASMTFGEDLVLADGTTPAQALAALAGAAWTPWASTAAWGRSPAWTRSRSSDPPARASRPAP